LLPAETEAAKKSGRGRQRRQRRQAAKVVVVTTGHLPEIRPDSNDDGNLKMLAVWIEDESGGPIDPQERSGINVVPAAPPAAGTFN